MENQEISKYYSFQDASDEVLKELFSLSNPEFVGCNVYQTKGEGKEMYVWVRANSLSFFDKVEETLNAQEIDLEEIRKIEQNFPNYIVRKDVP